ncbi:MAG: hypothetical protein ACKOTZ_04585 [Chloroflexota bacterium]
MPLDALPFTGDAEADALLARDPLALVIGFILDQRITVPKAFSAGRALVLRMGRLDAALIAATPLAEVEAVFSAKPALHRFPRVMAKRVHGTCAIVVRDHAGDIRGIWADGADARTVERRLCALPGISPFKARSIIGILARRLDVRPAGWEDHLPDEPSMADVVSAETLRAYQLGTLEMEPRGQTAADGRT